MSPAADPDPLEVFRSGRLGPVVRPPAFAPATDPHRLLSAVAEALNALERAGVTADVNHDAVSTRFGYVLPVGDARLGSRWAVREKLPAPEGDDEDLQLHIVGLLT